MFLGLLHIQAWLSAWVNGVFIYIRCSDGKEGQVGVCGGFRVPVYFFVLLCCCVDRYIVHIFLLCFIVSLTICSSPFILFLLEFPLFINSPLRNRLKWVESLTFLDNLGRSLASANFHAEATAMKQHTTLHIVTLRVVRYHL